MDTFKYLFQFETDGRERFWAKCDTPEPVLGVSVTAYPSFEDLVGNRHPTTAIVAKV